MPNLLENGSFETPVYTDPDNELPPWQLFGSGNTQSNGGGRYLLQNTFQTPIPDGAGCGEIAVNPSSTDSGIYQDVEVNAGTTVDLSLWYWLDSVAVVTPAPAFIVSITRQDTATVIFTTELAGADEWVAFQQNNINVGTASTPTVTLRLKILLDTNAGGTDVAWVDNVVLDGTAGGGPPPTVPPILECPEGGARYEVWLRNPAGDRVARMGVITGMNWAHIACGIGRFKVETPRVSALALGITDGWMVEIRRRLGYQPSILEFLGFVEQVERVVVARDDTEMLTLSGVSPNGLLQRRRVPIEAGDTGGTLTGTIDNLMKDIVRDHMGADADASREYDSSLFSVAADTSAGPSTTRTVALRNVWDVIRELWELSRAAGTEIFFEVKPESPPPAFTFRTSTGQLGNDLRGSLRFGTGYRNLVNPQISTSWAGTANVVYYEFGASSVEGDIEAGNTWARRETYEDTRGETGASGAEALATAALSRFGARTRFTADLLDSPSARYGCAWKCGDRIRAYEFGTTWDAIIRTVTVTVDGEGRETVKAQIEAIA